MRKLSLPIIALLLAAIAGAQPNALTIRVNVPSGLSSQMLPVLTTADLADVRSVLGQAPPTGLIAGAEDIGGQQRGVLGQLDVVGPQVRIALLLAPEPSGTRLIRIQAGSQTAGMPGPTPIKVARDGAKVTITNATYEITHDPAKNGGLPSRIVFPGTGKVFEGFSFNDRVYEGKVLGFLLADDKAPEVNVVAAGPLYAEVQVKARYMAAGKPAPDNPRATYTYSYFAGQPTFRVAGEVVQDDNFSWHELHFWELHFNDDAFTHWAANGEPVTPFKDDKAGHHGGQWGALVDGKNAIGLLGTALIYDGKTDYGRYLHGPWVQWATPRAAFAIDVWIGSADDPTQPIAAAAESKLRVLTGTLYTPKLLGLIAKLAERSKAEPRLGWMLSLLQGAVQQRTLSLTEAEQAAQGMLTGKPSPTLTLGSQKLQLRQTPALAMATTTTCTQIVSLYDLKRGRELLAAPSSLFQIGLQDPTGAARTVDSATLKPKSVDAAGGANALNVTYDLGASDRDLAGIIVRLRGRLEGDQARWQVDVDNPSTTWSLMRVVAPLLQVNAMGADAADDRLLVPSGFGRSYPVLNRPTYQGGYPDGNCVMQWMAVTDDTSGLYLGFHDPTAAYKILRSSEITGTGVPLQFEAPAPDATIPGNDYHPAGEIVMAAVGGGYYPSCRLYRQWLDKNAPWWPEPGKYARSDTPAWVDNIQTWTCTGGFSKDCVPQTKAFAAAMDAPTAIHWYSWHVIPFDNQYPHYFPTKEGFRDGVRELQQAGIRVMPYINGRLWDKDTDDFRDEAIRYCTKNAKLEPYIERYGSGRDLVPMCPYTQFWQDKVQSIVLKLVGEEGVDGVYIDQIGAAGPAPCYDKSHGHPLGGGHWWVDGYWKMLGPLQQKIAQVSPDKMLTTESNAEPYAKYLDAYLMCNDNSDYDAPLFPCVYGGKIQMFGTYMNGADWNDMTLMAVRQGKLFAFGTQLWWSDPNVIKNATAGKWLHDLAQLRRRVNEFFVRGQMAAPPVFSEKIDFLATDWAAWGPNKIQIHTPDLWATTWRLESGKLMMPLVNLPKQDRTFTLQFDPATYGLKAGAKVRIERMTPTGVSETMTKQGKFALPIKLGPAEATALVITPQ